MKRNKNIEMNCGEDKDNKNRNVHMQKSTIKPFSTIRRELHFERNMPQGIFVRYRNKILQDARLIVRKKHFLNQKTLLKLKDLFQ